MTFALPDWAPGLYESLHRHPELAFEEHRSAAAIADVLGRAGLDVRTGVGGTGLVAVLARGPGPVVAVRAELDALAIPERTDVAFHSTVPGVMHACGHDLHAVALAAAAAQLAADAGGMRGTLVAILQPAEEAGQGAAAMVADGLLDLVPRPDVLLAQHVSPFAPVGVLASTPGTALAGGDTVTVTARAAGGHTSAPAAGPDLVLFAAQLVQRIHVAAGRTAPAHEPLVMSVPAVVAPGGSGVRAPEVELVINIRSMSETSRRSALATVERLVRAEAAVAGLPFPAEDGYGVEVSATTVPPVSNDPALLARLRPVHEEAGLRHLPVPPTLASDDVSVLADAFGCPSAYWFVGCGPQGDPVGTSRQDCHTDRFLPEPATLAVATAALRTAVVAATEGRLTATP